MNAYLNLFTAGLLAVTDSSSSERYFGQSREMEWHTSILSLNTATSTSFNTPKRFSVFDLRANREKLESFRKLKEGWNGYDGMKINESVIEKVMDILPDLEFQPQIFPTGRGSLQLEKYIDDNNLIEIEVFEEEVSVYQVKGGEEIEREVTLDEIREIITDFYA